MWGLKLQDSFFKPYRLPLWKSPLHTPSHIRPWCPWFGVLESSPLPLTPTDTHPSLTTCRAQSLLRQVSTLLASEQVAH